MQQVFFTFAISDLNNRKASYPTRPTSVVTTQQEMDLMDFSSDVSSHSTKSVVAEDYDKLKESILKLSTSNSHQQHQQPNLQLMPYQQQQSSLSHESLNSLYSMSPNINQYYSQNMYFHAQGPPTRSPYPAIGFSHFVQQPNFSNYGLSNQYQSTSSSQTYNWSQHSQALAISTVSTPTQPPQQSIATFLAKQPQSSSEKVIPQILKPSIVNSSENLIDFNVDDAKYANILQSFDPLSNRSSTEDADNAYYTDQDPFEYIYSGGTQCSDPLYEAVVRSDHSLASPKSHPPEIYEYYAVPGSSDDPKKPPPLPPRNLSKSQSTENYEEANGSGQRFKRKLYENVTHLKKFDRDLTTFYTMVKELRSKYLFDHEESNIGHIIASELDNKYLNVSSIKLIVYPSLECFEGKYNEPFTDRNQENYQKLDGYGNPIVFTCDINSNILHVIIHVLENIEGMSSSNAEDFALKTIGSQEWLLHSSSLSHLEYIQSNIKLEKDAQLGFFPRQNKYMKIIARTRQDDVRDADIKFENILPKEAVSSISYDSLMILLETLEMEIEKLEASATDSTLHPSGVVQGVKAICALLGCIDTPDLFTAINNLKDACQNHSQSARVSFYKRSKHSF